MKKLLSLLLALMMCLGCTAFAEAAVDYVGYWVLAALEVAGMQADPATVGLSAYMEIYEGGACLLVAGDTVQDGTWVATETGIETTDAEGTVDAMTYVDGNLVAEQEGIKLIFVRQEYTAPMEGLTEADFAGVWNFAYLEYLGTAYDAAEVGTAMVITLEEGKGKLEMSYEGGAESYNATTQLVEYPGFGTVLFFFYLDENGAETGEGMVLLKFDNDELVWYVVDEYDNDIYYCFNRG